MKYESEIVLRKKCMSEKWKEREREKLNEYKGNTQIHSYYIILYLYVNTIAYTISQPISLAQFTLGEFTSQLHTRTPQETYGLYLSLKCGIYSIRFTIS